MKYFLTISGAVLLGLHWKSELGWLIVSVAAVFIINALNGLRYENNKENNCSE